MRKRDDRIELIEHDSDGWWITLKPGWRIPGDAHAIVEDRKQDALDKVDMAVPCDCAECRTMLAAKGGKT